MELTPSIPSMNKIPTLLGFGFYSFLIYMIVAAGIGVSLWAIGIPWMLAIVLAFLFFAAASAVLSIDPKMNTKIFARLKHMPFRGYLYVLPTGNYILENLYMNISSLDQILDTITSVKTSLFFQKNKLFNGIDNNYSRSYGLQIPFYAVEEYFDKMGNQLYKIMNDNNSETIVFKLKGLDLATANDAHFEHAFRTKADFFLQDFSKYYTYSFYAFTNNRKAHVEDLVENPLKTAAAKESKTIEERYPSDPNFPSKETGIIDSIWKKSFDVRTETTYYVAVTKSTEEIVIGDFGNVEYVANTLAANFSIYEPKQCNDKELYIFLQKLFYNYDVDPSLELTLPFIHDGFIRPILFKENYVEFPTSNGPKFSTSYTFKNYPPYIDDELIKRITNVDFDMCITVHAAPFSQDESNKRGTKKQATFAGMMKNTEKLQGEIMSVVQRVRAGEVSLGEGGIIYTFFANSYKELLLLDEYVRRIFLNNKLDAEPMYFNTQSMFYIAKYPSKFKKCFSLKQLITNEMAANFMVALRSPVGFKKTDLGEMPLQIFKNVDMSLYNFNFHVSPEQSAVGHTLVAGTTGSGKSMTTSFLCNSSFRYPNMKLRMFDSLNGLYCFTKSANGIYQDFTGKVGLNPFLFVRDTSNVYKKSELISLETEFITNFTLGMLMDNSTGEERGADLRTKNEIKEIALKIVTGQNSLSTYDRKLKDKTIFGVYLENLQNLHSLEYRNILGNFSPKVDTPESRFFNPHQNGLEAIDFNNRMLAFNLSNLRDEKQKTLVGIYLIYNMYREYEPMIIFFDEYAAVLKNKIFADMSLKLLLEGRKLRKTVLACVQDVTQITKNPHINGDQFLSSFHRLVVFPKSLPKDPKTLDEVITKYSLNESDLDWVATASPSDYRFLTKITESNGVVLNANLGLLNLRSEKRNYFRCFNSSATDARALKYMEERIQLIPGLSPAERRIMLMEFFLRERDKEYENLEDIDFSFDFT